MNTQWARASARWRAEVLDAMTSLAGLLQPGATVAVITSLPFEAEDDCFTVYPELVHTHVPACDPPASTSLPEEAGSGWRVWDEGVYDVIHCDPPYKRSHRVSRRTRPQFRAIVRCTRAPRAARGRRRQTRRSLARAPANDSDGSSISSSTSDDLSHAPKFARPCCRAVPTRVRVRPAVYARGLSSAAVAELAAVFALPANTRTMCQFDDLMVTLARERLANGLKDSTSTRHGSRRRHAMKARGRESVARPKGAGTSAPSSTSPPQRMDTGSMPAAGPTHRA